MVETIRRENDSFVGNLPQDFCFPDFVVWPHMKTPDTNKVVPLKFVGKIKGTKEEDLYLFYSSPGYENEDDENGELTLGLNAVITADRQPDKIVWQKLDNNISFSTLFWSEKSYLFDGTVSAQDFIFYDDSIKFVLKNSGMEIPNVSLVAIIPTGYKNDTNFSWGDGESLLVLKDKDSNSYYISQSNL